MEDRALEENEETVPQPNICGMPKSIDSGHLERIEEDRSVKKAYLGIPMGVLASSDTSGNLPLRGTCTSSICP
ncbi:unnamed protein product [Pieris macdunnoughi]|uniref:Uncharacterized protein n=1 Tax=Pieris macdunnoughi TaxID=345717 RepID=A0A821WIW7_9NEOP|nr:unnamed protein product [Pieris macdunnoughi]